MLASGLPERSGLHARNIALVALDMMDIARDIVVADGEFPVRVSSTHTGRESMMGYNCARCHSCTICKVVADGEFRVSTPHTGKHDQTDRCTMLCDLNDLRCGYGHWSGHCGSGWGIP